MATITEDQKSKNVKAFEALVKVAAHGGPINPFEETFSLAKIESISGTWYFGIECPACKRTTVRFKNSCGVYRLPAA